MNEFNFFFRDISISALPFVAGIIIYSKDEIISKIIAVILFLFGIIIISILIYDYLETRKVRRRHLGYGDLK